MVKALSSNECRGSIVQGNIDFKSGTDSKIKRLIDVAYVKKQKDTLSTSLRQNSARRGRLQIDRIGMRGRMVIATTSNIEAKGNALTL
jgi:hypothetical protein